MELKRYLTILLHWWWLVLTALVTTIAASLAFTYTSPPIYEATTRFVISPTAAAEDDLEEQRASLNALNKPIIANTYAEIAQSPSIVQAAWEQLETPPDQREGFEIRASVLQNTNILVITVTGPDPTLVHQLATAVSQLTLDYVAKLYEVYDLKPLDLALVPHEPISPNKKLNLVLGIGLGLGIGVLFAFLAEYLKTPANPVAQTSIVDVKTGAYTVSYFLRRTQEEIKRSQRTQRSFVVGVIRIKDPDEVSKGLPSSAHEVLLKQVIHLLKQHLSEENLVGRWHGDDIAVLLPDCDSEAAQQILERFQNELTWTPFEIEGTGHRLNLTASLGSTEYNLDGVGPKDLLNQAERILDETEARDN